MRTFILIADGSRASLLDWTTQKLTLIESWDNQDGRTPDHDRMTDSAGSSDGSSLSPQTDPKRHAKQVFAHRLAAQLKERLKSYDRLVVAAAPKLLGDLRKEYDPAVQKKIFEEIAKDLTHVPVHDLKGHFANLDPYVGA